jgi:CRP-like cAMP-binding protein
VHFHHQWIVHSNFCGIALFHQGDIWLNVVFLASGQLRWILLSAGGRECVLSTIESGGVLWGHSIFDDQPMPACVMAAQASDVYQWSREVILPVLYRNPSAMWEITKVQVRAMRRAREIIYGLAFQPVASRLAKLLLQRFAVRENIPVERDLTLSEIAAMIASSPEVVCRLLHQFQMDGVLEITRAHITLHDREALERLVQ